MAIVKGEIQNNTGDIIYPHTTTDIVFDENGKTLSQKLIELDAKIPVGGGGSGTDYTHPATHPASMITGLPEVKNTLTETTVGNTLDATQGKILNDKIDSLVIPEEYIHPETHDVDMITGLPEVKNTLTETTTGNVLDAVQGKVLNDKIDAIVAAGGYVHPATHDASMITGLPEVKNTLTETTTGNVLDATQGKVLNDKIDALVIPAEYTHPATHPASMITGLPTSLPANGGNSDTVDGKHADDFVLKTEVKNNLTEEVEGNVLDATQGKILNDKISKVYDDLGTWYDSDWKFETASPSTYPNGVSYFYSGSNSFGDSTYVVVKTTKTYTMVKQEIFRDQQGLVGGLLKYRLSSRHTEDTWADWNQIATTTKSAILLTPPTGYTINQNESYIVSGIAYLNFTLSKSSLQDFEIGSSVITMNKSALSTSNAATCVFNGAYNEVGSCRIINNTIEIYKPSNSTGQKYVTVTGTILL